jgi:DNA primase
MIKPESLRLVAETADIVEVIQDYVTLKKKGQSYTACCPFHNEKSPSFYVTPSKGIFKCFGCGKAGDAITFIREIEGIGYLEAIRILANKYHIVLEESASSDEHREEQTHKEALLIVLNYAKNFFQQQLTETPEGKSIAVSYLKERGFLDKTIQKFELGYSQNDWHALENDAVKKGYNKTLLEQAGLIVTSEDGGKKYDRFRGRVIFPIHNLAGKTIGFGARTLKKDEKPKYLNSPETEVYSKSDVLYGMFQAKNAIRLSDNCYLTEGYTDVISLHQAGIENVVASSGTSLTEGQIKLIKRFTSNVTILYDGDSAGIKASLRGIDLLLTQDLNVRVVLFPDGEDPDSYSQKIGSVAFKEYLEQNSKDFILFKTELQLQEAQNDPIKRATVIRSIVESIIKIPDAIKRTVFYKTCAQLLDVDENTLIEEGKTLFLREQQAKIKREKNKPTPRPNVGINLDLPPGIIPPLQGDTPPPLDEQYTFGNDYDTDIYVYDSLVADDQENTQISDLPDFIDYVPPTPTPSKKERLEKQEEENIRILMLYGNKPVSDGRTLAQYLINEAKDLYFTNHLYQKIYNEILAQIASEGNINESSFLHHSDEQVKQFYINAVSERHTLSEHWSKMGVYVPAKDKDLAIISFRSIVKRKFEFVKQIAKDCLTDLQNAKESAQIHEIQTLYIYFKQQENELAKILGIVIS